MGIARTRTAALVLFACLGCAASQRVTLPLIPPFPIASTAPIRWAEPFDALEPGRWRNVEVKGRTEYEAVELDGRRCVKAESHGGASILLTQVEFDPETYEWLSWRWRVDQLVAGEDLSTKEGSDAPARVYVYFKTPGLPWQKRSIDYVWSASLPVDTVISSAYAQEAKIIVVESGPAHVGQWRSVTRNLEDDYERCFGKQHLPDIIAIGLMTDTDNTGADALAYFDDLRVSLTAHPIDARARRR